MSHQKDMDTKPEPSPGLKRAQVLTEQAQRLRRIEEALLTIAGGGGGGQITAADLALTGATIRSVRLAILTQTGIEPVRSVQVAHRPPPPDDDLAEAPAPNVLP